MIFTSILGIAATPVRAHTEEEPFKVDLIAGGGNEKSAIDVGDVLVWNDADFLYVQYILDDGWCLTETHLHVATELVDIPQTKKGNPIPGHFTYNNEWDSCKTEHTYPIPLLWPSDQDLYIAAHAVVKKITGYESDLAGFGEDLPDQVTMTLAYPGTSFGDPSYFDVTITGGTSLDGVYDDYCIDTDQFISSGVPYTANVYSSYENLPMGLVEFPENLDLVNWIINQDYVSQSSPCGGEYTYGDVQKAIWELIEDTPSTVGLGPWNPCRVDEILTDVNAFGEGFEPECGDVVAVILAPVDCSQIPIAQVTFAEVELPCIPIYQEETAWGDGEEFNIDKNWATYFTYIIQGVEMQEEWPEGGTLSIAYEDLPIDGGNDWDYNDFVVDIEVLAIFFGTSMDRDLIQMDFTIRPEAKLAGYTHRLHLNTSFFSCGGTYELYRDGSLIESGIFGASTDIDVILVPNTGSPPTVVVLNIIFDEGCEFSFPDWDQNLYHGENLFYDPYLYVYNTGEEIHAGDVRMLTVPTDWQWPTPDANAIWNVYPKVTAGNPPTFQPYWWTPL